jgi:hypothetical protein
MEWGERKPNMGYEEIDAIDGLLIGADISCKQYLVGPISRIGSAMGRGLETVFEAWMLLSHASSTFQYLNMLIHQY